MRIFLSLFLVSFQLQAACDFKAGVKKVISLSGSSTVILKELGLLKKVQGISVFNPLKASQYSGKVYPGGIFLSHGALGELENSVVFYDESRDLKKVLSSRATIKSIEVHTRNLTPREAVEGTLKLLSPYLVSCEESIKLLQTKITTLEGKLLKAVPTGTAVVFYLGELRSQQTPEFVMVNDGVVKWLIQQKKIKSYPTELAYVNWSAKLMREMPANTWHVGIKDPGREDQREIKKSSRRMTLIYPGSLVPGLTQLEAFLYWAETTF